MSPECTKEKETEETNETEENPAQRKKKDVQIGIEDAFNTLLSSGSKAKYKAGILHALSAPSTHLSFSSNTLQYAKQTHPRIYAALLQNNPSFTW
ncbi:hypothetical protein NECID01_1704 [Nematocida sp. AWRm77]|nr:hypothetical protein NECID01_1704 [Nematocida sp. AWRm77]